jgi:uncharacterized protein
VGRATALLGMVAGGSAGVVAVADEIDADARLVAVMQYVRVALVALTIPLVAAILHAHGHRHAVADVASVGDTASSIAMLLVVALAGLWLGGECTCRPLRSPVRCCSRRCWGGAGCFRTRACRTR